MASLCPLCGEYAAVNVSHHLKHIRLIHSNMSHFSIDCRLKDVAELLKTGIIIMYAFHSGSEWDNQDCQTSIQDSECFQNDHQDEFSTIYIVMNLTVKMNLLYLL